MGKLNIYVKWSYIIVASLLAIISTVILARTLFYHGYLHKHEEIDKILPGFIVMYVLFIITLLLPIIGVYGARKEKKWALIVFTVGMILCTLVMLNSERQQLTLRPEIKKAASQCLIDNLLTNANTFFCSNKIAERVKANYLGFLPLSNASMNDIESLKYIQMELQCCGLDQGYQDWGYNISESCLCLQDSTNPCVEAPKNSSLFEHRKHDQPIMIYKEPCVRYLIQLALAAINLVIGIEWGLILIWTLSVVLCIIILFQLRQEGDTPPVVYSAEAKSGNYGILTETADYT